MKNSKIKVSTTNTNGVSICDSIVMSVKKRRINLRQFESVGIAIIGFVSVIMSFLSMFEFNYNRSSVLFAAVIFSIIYIFLSLVGKKSVWLIIASVIGFTIFAYKVIDSLALGYKYVYNVIYHKAFITDISYYKFLKPELEEQSTTAFFIMCIWLLAIVIYYFTICHPNPILPIIITFPIIEIGLYNGIELPIFWGILVIAYWLALFAMSTIDLGEYSGGSGGFVRKDNLFFPKRQMRLKVTEACGVFVIICVLTVAVLSSAVINLTGYKRSDEINRKRIDIRDAVTSFSLSNFADSVSSITSAFGFSFKYDDHKLGNIDHLKYKNTVDLKVNIDKKFDTAIYLKDYTGSVYDDNKWTSLDDSAYNADIFKDFKNNNMYPQLLPGLINSYCSNDDIISQISIESKLRGDRYFTPYGVLPSSDLKYDNDLNVHSEKKNNNYNYKITAVNTDGIGAILGNDIINVYNTNDITSISQDNYDSGITDPDNIVELCKKYDLLNYDNYFTLDLSIPHCADICNYPTILLSEVLQYKYKEFVYDNYLQVPDNNNMNEVRNAYLGLINIASSATSAEAKINALIAMREKISSEVSYSLYPGKTPSNRDFVNYFLLENKKGYCMHYATSGVILARMAGIPARYATGYVVVGDDFNDSTINKDQSYTIELRDNRSHAWTEIYLDDYGWVPFEFTAGYSNQTIDTTPSTSTTEPSTETTVTVSSEIVSDISAETNDGDNNTNQNNEKKNDTVTASVVTTTKEANGIGSNQGDGTYHPSLLSSRSARIIFLLILILLTAIVIFSRRKLILYLRRKHFTEGNSCQRIEYLYEYIDALLDNIEIHKDKMSYSDFADAVEDRIGGRYFDKGDFKSFIDTSLLAEFGEISPSEEEISKIRKMAERLAQSTYNTSNIIKKIIMKFISVLI